MTSSNNDDDEKLTKRRRSLISSPSKSRSRGQKSRSRQQRKRRSRSRSPPKQDIKPNSNVLERQRQRERHGARSSSSSGDDVARLEIKKQLRRTLGAKQERKQSLKPGERSPTPDPNINRAAPANNTPVPGGKQIGVRGEWAEFQFPDGSKLFRHIITGEIVTGIPTVSGSGQPIPGPGGALGIPVAPDPSTVVMKIVEPKVAPNTTLFVLHMPASWTENDLQQHFNHFGSITRADLPKNADGTRKGYGFVSYNNQEEAQRAIDHMNGFPVMDIHSGISRNLSVSYRTQHGSGGTVASQKGSMAPLPSNMTGGLGGFL